MWLCIKIKISVILSVRKARNVHLDFVFRKTLVKEYNAKTIKYVQLESALKIYFLVRDNASRIKIVKMEGNVFLEPVITFRPFP